MPKLRIVRVVTASIVILVVFLGAVGKLGYGTICSLGAWHDKVEVSFVHRGKYFSKGY